MNRKPVRFGLLIVGLLVTSVLGYQAVQDEASLGRTSREWNAADRAAEQALTALVDLRGALHAYVAPGQGLPFWSGRSREALDALRKNLMEVDGALPAGASLDSAQDAVDQLVTAERRAREYATRGETLLSADVIFTEVRDLVTSSVGEVQEARSRLAAQHDRQASGLRRKQTLLAAAVVLTWIGVAILLMPTPPPPPKKKDEWLDQLAETIKKPIPKEPLPKPTKLEPVVPAPAVLAPPPAPAEPAIAVKAVRAVGEICSDLSTLSDTGALNGALERTAGVLKASGLIVWVASNDATALAPVATYGFDPKLVARIGRIPRDSSNLTAAAFRENTARISAGTDTTPAALAVSLCGPSGPVGVLSVELQTGVPADEGRVALATIFAAQLSTLAAPVPSVNTAPRAEEAKKVATQ
jgi:hypothetical protein